MDWAALAQAWIAQKESSGPGTEQQQQQQPPPPQQPMQPNGQDIPGLEPTAHNNHGNFQGDPNFNRMWQPGTHILLLKSHPNELFVNKWFVYFLGKLWSSEKSQKKVCESF